MKKKHKKFPLPDNIYFINQEYFKYLLIYGNLWLNLSKKQFLVVLRIILVVNQKAEI